LRPCVSAWPCPSSRFRDRGIERAAIIELIEGHKTYNDVQISPRSARAAPTSTTGTTPPRPSQRPACSSSCSPTPTARTHAAGASWRTRRTLGRSFCPSFWLRCPPPFPPSPLPVSLLYTPSVRRSGPGTSPPRAHTAEPPRAPRPRPWTRGWNRRPRALSSRAWPPLLRTAPHS